MFVATRLAATALPIAVLTSCATTSPSTLSDRRSESPARTAVFISTDTRVQTRVVPLPLDTVWNRLAAVYEKLGVPVKFADRAGYQLGNAGFRTQRIAGEPLSRFIECGAGGGSLGYANDYDVTLGVVTILGYAGRDSTNVGSVVQAIARPRDVGTTAVACESRGTLEKRIAELIAQDLSQAPTAIGDRP